MDKNPVSFNNNDEALFSQVTYSIHLRFSSNSVSPRASLLHDQGFKLLEFNGLAKKTPI